MDRVALVVERFKDDLDCAQALLCIYGPEYGLDSEMAVRIADAFTGGIGRTGRTCGAVTGALMVMGLKYGEKASGNCSPEKKTHRLTKEFINRFISLNGSITCKELLDCDLSKPEVLGSKETKHLFQNLCPKYVQDAAELIEELL